MDIVNEEMQGHAESIDDDLTLVPPPGWSPHTLRMQGVDLVNEEMQGHMESIDNELTLVSPAGWSSQLS